ncbi:uncharacterized protein B0H64DRAFT_185610 [Chaetomium fimeti]|uniref:Uncharacterized protein n=1 Tax=Chaetomium fimeti TaxID=1854472 RepID=A0AAE0LR38_9PEZI|nr:hypothetical protein B0H64DRAFT_185610 [Chaetomium fimeti]
MANNYEQNTPIPSHVLASSMFRTISLAQVDQSRLLDGIHQYPLCAGCNNAIKRQDPFEVYCPKCGHTLWCNPGCTRFPGRSFQINDKTPRETLIPDSWALHEQLCFPTIQRRPFGGRDFAYHRQACLFPVGQDTPQIIWVHYDWGTATLTVEDPSFHAFGVQTDSEPTRCVLLRDGYQMENWTFRFDLLLLSYPQVAQAIPPNMASQSIAALAKPLQLKTWFGPVVAIAVSPNPSGKHCLVQDITPRDITAAVIYHLTHLDNPCRPLAQFWPGADDAYPVLKLTDAANHFITSAFGHQPPMAPVLVASWKGGIWKPCTVAHRLGLRWYISSGNCRSWQDMDRGPNPDARWLKYVFGDDQE